MVLFTSVSSTHTCSSLLQMSSDVVKVPAPTKEEKIHSRVKQFVRAHVRVIGDPLGDYWLECALKSVSVKGRRIIIDGDCVHDRIIELLQDPACKTTVSGQPELELKLTGESHTEALFRFKVQWNDGTSRAG